VSSYASDLWNAGDALSYRPSIQTSSHPLAEISAANSTTAGISVARPSSTATNDAAPVPELISNSASTTCRTPFRWVSAHRIPSHERNSVVPDTSAIARAETLKIETTGSDCRVAHRVARTTPTKLAATPPAADCHESGVSRYA
jgi:hypothetical protein